MRKTYENTIEGRSQLHKDLLKEAVKSGKHRIRITAEYYDDKCTKCNKPIQIGKESEYCGCTMCIDCKSSHEEFDEEYN